MINAQKDIMSSFAYANIWLSITYKSNVKFYFWMLIAYWRSLSILIPLLSCVIDYYFSTVILALCLCVIPFCPAKAQDVIPIPVNPGHNGGDTPRSGDTPPIQVYLVGTNLTIQLLPTLENVTIALENAITGLVFQTVVNGSEYPIIIPLLQFILSFSLSSGVVYYAYLYLNS